MTEKHRYAGFKVLIVDDNPNNLFTLRSLIEKYTDVHVIEADGGEKAVNLALTENDVDLIILDVQMPEMDGFQTASMLKVRKKTRDIPVIFLTAAYKTDEFQQKGYDVGAADYLLKPIDDNLLLNKLTAYFRLIEKERALNVLLEEKVAQRTAELEQIRRYQERLLNTMGEALLVLSPEGQIKSTNPAAQKMLGYEETELVDLSISDVFEEAEDEQAGAFFGTWLEAMIRAGAVRDVEARFIAKNGSLVPILFSRTAMLDEAGVVTDIICIAKNMTGYVKIDDDDDLSGSDLSASNTGDSL
ncbi:MAG: response regulator [Gammaproteobacteria bacterium]|nr:response regulator [Gammaproteobacteria bacterium]NNJ51040.1 response regulator [Gammaproteobacteria bacterium]